MSAVFEQTASALKEAASDARVGWRPLHALLVAVFASACALPWFAPGWVRIDSVAGWLYLALSATGLSFAVGLAGLPSLGQAAFMSLGALTTGLLAARAGWAPEATVPVAVLVSALIGLLVGFVVVRLPHLFIAVSTWILTWLVTLTATEFPGISGGAQGFVVSSGLGPIQHYELALGLTAAVATSFAVVRRSTLGLRLLALRDSPASAANLGVPRDRLLIGSFVTSAAIGGLAGSLAVQLAGVTDPGAFGPFTSFQLLVAVLLGGAAWASGGAIGVAVLAGIALLAHGWAAVEGHAPPQFDALFASLLVLIALARGSNGIAPWLASTRRRRRSTPRRQPLTAKSRHPPAELRAEGMEVRYDGLVALLGFDLTVTAGETVALVGPNGSGKTTALRALAGTLRPRSGRVVMDGTRLGVSQQARVEAGIVRTLQRTAVFPDLTVLENAVVGASLHQRYGGALRTLASTPKARRERAESYGRALASLRLLELEHLQATRVAELDGQQQRLVMIASALAARPRVLLLDEPSAGASVAEADRLANLLGNVRRSGLSIVIVEHNLRFVHAVADRVVVLVAGEVIAEGSAAEVTADPHVRRVYLGRRK